MDFVHRTYGGLCWLWLVDVLLLAAYDGVRLVRYAAPLMLSAFGTQFSKGGVLRHSVGHLHDLYWP